MSYLVGQKFGRLTVTKDSGKRNHKNIVWECSCECGGTAAVTTNALNMGKTKTCSQCRFIKLIPGEAGFRELLRSYRRDAKRRGLIFELSNDQFRKIITSICYYCGDRLEQVKYSRGNPGKPGYESSAFKYTGLDRQNPNDGYTINNVVACCRICNFMKGVLTHGQFVERIRKIFGHLCQTSDCY